MPGPHAQCPGCVLFGVKGLLRSFRSGLCISDEAWFVHGFGFPAVRFWVLELKCSDGCFFWCDLKMLEVKVPKKPDPSSPPSKFKFGK